MSAFLINIIHNFILIFVLVSIFKKKQDRAIIWYIVSSMFFISIPLLFDSIIGTLFGMEAATALRMRYDPMWDIFNFSVIADVSLCALIFDIVVLIVYGLMNRNRYDIFDASKATKINWQVLFLISYGAFVVFMINQGLTKVSNLGIGGGWNDNNIGNRWVTLLFNILVTTAPVGLIKGFYKKQYILAFLSVIPLILIEYISEARALVIAAGFAFCYYMVSQLSVKGWSMWKICLCIISGYVINILFTFYRSHNVALYPLMVDPSYGELYYSYFMSDIFSTRGNNFLRMLSTGIYSPDISENLVEESLANLKYHYGWGTLHPTVVGWSVFDMKKLFFIPAAFWGFFYAIFDRIRYKMPPAMSVLFLTIIFRFTPILVRGSVQYAYTVAFYPIIFFVLCWLFINVTSNSH